MKIKRPNRSPAGFNFFLALLAILLASLACGIPAEINIPDIQNPEQTTPPREEPTRGSVATQAVIPTITLSPSNQQGGALPENGNEAAAPSTAPGNLVELHDQANPGVVNINVLISQGLQTGQGAGSGFILDDQRHIVTNNHVVAGADQVTVIFYNSLEVQANVVGTDDDSDLAVIQVDELADGAHPLTLADSDQVQVGEWVIAIGNPFGLGSSMSVGIVSAIGRTIESGVTPFSIPQAIQTDAAINPGNSGGPLINMQGQVIGVNAQIAADPGVRANAGVGFAIPSNVVRRVAPVLIERGEYVWPWLGVTGAPLNLAIIQANNLDVQQGAYIDEVVPGGPADKAGLQGSSDPSGQGIPRGGDVVVAVDGNPVKSFDDLLTYISSKNPGDQVVLTILRNGKRMDVPVTLEARPQNFNPQDFNP